MEKGIDSLLFHFFISIPKMAGYQSRALSITMLGERHSLVDLMGDEALPTTDFGHLCAIKWPYGESGRQIV